jgi:hypothetical protein
VLCLWGDQHGRPLALESKETDPWEPFNETAFPKHRKGTWLLNTSIIRNYCISHPEGQFSTSVGDLTYLGQKFYNDTAQETQWWGAPNHTKPYPTHWPTFLISRKSGTILLKTQIGRHPRDYTGSVGSKLIWCYLEAGLGLVC